MKASDFAGHTKLPRRPLAARSRYGPLGPQVGKPALNYRKARLSLSWIHTYMWSVFITLTNVNFCFWGHDCLSDRLIVKRYSTSNASPWVEEKSSSSWPSFMSVSCSWCKILLFVHKHSTCTWAFYHWAEAWHVNGNTAADHYTFQKCSALGYGSSFNLRYFVIILFIKDGTTCVIAQFQGQIKFFLTEKYTSKESNHIWACFVCYFQHFFFLKNNLSIPKQNV